MISSGSKIPGTRRLKSKLAVCLPLIGVLLAWSGDAFARTPVDIKLQPATQAEQTLVAASDYICTPSGFGRKATCRLQTL